MEIINVGTAPQTNLFLAIEKQLSSLRKRNVTYIINPHTDKAAVVILMVNGKRGTVQKDFVLIKDVLLGTWTLYCQEYEYHLNSLSELSTIARSIIARLQTLMMKL